MNIEGETGLIDVKEVGFFIIFKLTKHLAGYF